MNKQFRYIYILATSLFLLVNCTKKSNDVVVLEPTINLKLHLGKTTQLISLERTDESQLETIKKAATDLSSDRIFVLSDFNLFVFDANGKFITKLKKGRGPGEVSKILYFAIDKEKKLIYATQDRANIITIIGYDGEVKKNHTIVDYYCQSIEPIDENNVFLLNNTASKTDPFFIGKCNLQEEIVGQRFISAEESNYPLLTFPMVSNFTRSDGRLFFAHANIFGLYEYKKNQFHKIVTYELGERQVPKRFSERYEKNRRMGIFLDETIRNGYVPNLLSTFYFKEYNLVIIGDENNSCYAINKNKPKDVYLNGAITEYFNLPNVESLKNPVEIDEDYLTFGCEPLDFFKIDEVNENKQIKIEGHTIEVSYESNPFLVIVK
jgi:hypothetical protein